MLRRVCLHSENMVLWWGVLLVLVVVVVVVLRCLSDKGWLGVKAAAGMRVQRRLQPACCGGREEAAT